MPENFRAVDVTRAGEIDFKFLLDASGSRAENKYAISQGYGFADIVRDKDNGLARGLPDGLQFLMQDIPGLGI